MNNLSSSLCLPIEVERIIVNCVHKSNTIDDVIEAFKMTHLAEIQSAILVPRTSVRENEPYNNAILMVKNWKDNKSARNFQLTLRDNSKESRLVYDDPWYWVIKEDVEFYKNDFKIEFDFKKIEHVSIASCL
jgi:hypothetical protein